MRVVTRMRGKSVVTGAVLALAAIGLAACGSGSTTTVQSLDPGAPAGLTNGSASAAPVGSTSPDVSTSPSTSAAAAGLDTTQHDNEVTFNTDGSKWPVTVSFTIDDRQKQDYSITSGQPWGGVNVCGGGGSCMLDAKAGRHNSSGPANFFKSNAQSWLCTGPDALMGDCKGPSDLNFAFTGTLLLRGVNSQTQNYPVVIGQGSDGASANNWWIGGMSPNTSGSWAPAGLAQGSIKTPDGWYSIQPDDGKDDQFTIVANYGP